MGNIRGPAGIEVALEEPQAVPPRRPEHPPRHAGNRHPGVRSQRDNLKPKPSPSKAPKMLHFRAPQLFGPKANPRVTSAAGPPVCQPPRSLPASQRERVPHQPPTSCEVGCGWPCRRGREGLRLPGAALPQLCLASCPSTLRQRLLQTSATSAAGGPRLLLPICWPNPARCHLSHRPGDSWGPSGVTHRSARARWLQGSCARPSRMRASPIGEAGAVACCWPESAVGSATVPWAHAGPPASQTAFP